MKVLVTLFNTDQAVKYLLSKLHLKAEFKNARNKDMEIFRCTDGTIGIGEIGNGLVTTFNENKHKNDLWILRTNKYI